MRITVVLLAILLSGCSGLAGKPSVGQLADEKSTCQSYGFQPDSDEFASCTMQLDMARQERSREALGRFARAMQRMSQEQRARQVTCVTHPGMYLGNGMYGTSTTTCN